MKNLKELTKNRIYRIPDYQRGYSWEKKQIRELIDDIENIRLKNEQSYHFTGILSYSKIGIEEFNSKEGTAFTEKDEIEFYHITDGQQRLTTMYILLFEAYKIKYPSDFHQKFLDATLTVNHNGKRVYKFGYDIDVPSREHLLSVIFEDDNYQVRSPETLYTNNLDAAKASIKERLLEMDEGALKLFQRKLEQRLLFQEFVIDTSKLDVSMVFETMNYRGKNLSKLELFKNRLIYLIGNAFPDGTAVKSLRKEITDAWLNVYAWLGKKSEVKLNDDAFLTAFTIMHFNTKGTVDSEFKNIIDRLFNVEFPIHSKSSNINLSEPNLNELSRSLELSVKTYYLIFNPFTDDPEIEALKISVKIKRQIFIINQIGGASYIKTLLTCALARYMKSGSKNEIEFLDFLKEVEKHQMLVFNLLGRKINANRAEIYRICNDIYTGKVSLNEAIDRISLNTNKWWNKPNVFKIIQDNLNESKERFLNLNGIKMILFLKEVDIERIPLDIQNVSDYRLGLVFPEGHGANTKFSKVVRSRTPISIDYLRYSLGNIVILERQLAGKFNTASHNYIEERSKQLSKSLILDNKTVASKISKWSDLDILNRGIDILTYMKERYNLSKLNETNMRHILVDDLVIEQKQ